MSTGFRQHQGKIGKVRRRREQRPPSPSGRSRCEGQHLQNAVARVGNQQRARPVEVSNDRAASGRAAGQIVSPTGLVTKLAINVTSLEPALMVMSRAGVWSNSPTNSATRDQTAEREKAASGG